MGKLTVEEIRYLRWYHRDPEIANKVVVPVNTNKQPSANVQTKKPTKKEIAKTIEMLEQEMREAAKNLDFERAMELRDILFEMKTQ